MEVATKFLKTKTFIKSRTNTIVTKLANLKASFLKKKFVRAVLERIQPIFNRQKKAFLFILPASIFIIIGVNILMKTQINNLKQELADRGLLIIKLFPEKEAANWLARALSKQHDWQVKSLFKLKAILNSVVENSQVSYALIVNGRNGNIEAHTTPTLVRTPYKPVVGDKIFQGEGEFVAQRYQDSQSNYIVDFALPIYFGKDRIGIGAFHFGLSFEEIERALKKRKVLFPLLISLIIVIAIGSVVVKDRIEISKMGILGTAEKHRTGQYILEEKIATGGMGEIYIARKEVGSFKMRAVIKRVLPERATDEKFITSFLDEANLASQLRHPNIVTIHDFGNDQGTYFIAMEFIDGENLLVIMKACENKVPIKYTLYIIAEACKGLDYAHNKIDDFSKKPLNIVHRDVSPQNILVAFDGDVKIVDFGIAKATQRQGKNTTVGIVKGKLLYMSPEQASGKADIDRKSDIFSLGLLFYELLSGESAYNGETFQEILTLACQAKMITIEERVKNLPADLNQIVKKVLEPNPENRYQTAELLIKDIIKFLRKNPEFSCSKAEMAKFMQEKFKDKKKPQS